MSGPLPRENSELIGHEAAEEALRAAFASGRLPHAWLIGGPAGIGKATLAFRFARFVLAGGAGQEERGLAVDPASPVFRRIAAGAHPDLLVVERLPAGDGQRRPRELAIDEVRRIAPFLRLTPAEGGWRVVIVDEAETMNRSGANAILKILEEPPPRSLLLLVSGAPGALLPTLRSRCRRLVLRPLGEAALGGFLARRAPDLTGPERLAVARLAEGSPGRALQLLEGEGLGLYRTLVELLQPLPSLDRLAVHALADRLGAPSAEPAYVTLTELLVQWLGRVARLAAGGETPVEIVPGELATLRRLVGTHGLDRWLELWDNTRRLLERAESVSLDRKQVLLQAFFSLATASRP